MDPRKPLRATWPAPWHILAPTRVPGRFPSRHDTPAMRRAAAAPPARRRAPLTQIDRPQSLHSSPRSSLAYKDPQNPTDAPLLPLLPPSAAPPWPPRSRSRGPASPAPHCPLRAPQQLRHLLVTLHARGIEPKPPPDAVPLLRRRRRAQAHRGPASSGEDRARQLPQKHPRAHAVLVRALFPYPEPSFTSSAGEPNNRPAIDADQGRCSSIPTLPRASPW